MGIPELLSLPEKLEIGVGGSDGHRNRELAAHHPGRLRNRFPRGRLGYIGRKFQGIIQCRTRPGDAQLIA